jgi:GINS complex subunit 4
MSNWEEDDYIPNAHAGPSSSFVDRLQNARDDDDVLMPGADPDFAFLLPDPNETPLQQLVRHWMNERHAPDILPAQEDLLSGLLDHIRKQVGEFRFKSA